MTEPMKRHVAAYTRVSTAKQDYEIQRDAIIEWAAQKGVTIDGGWYRDIVSGAKDHRPGIEHLLENVNAGHIGRVIVFAWDRLGRSMIDVTEKLVQFSRAKCGVVSITQNVDSQDPQGFLIVTMLSFLAEAERRAIIDRTTHGQRLARARGVLIGRPPLIWLPGQREAMIAAMEADPTGNDATAINKAALAVGPYTYLKGPPRDRPMSIRRLQEFWDKWASQGWVKQRPGRRATTPLPGPERNAAERQRNYERNLLLWSPYPPTMEEARKLARTYRDTHGQIRRHRERVKLAPVDAAMLAQLPVYTSRDALLEDLERVPLPKQAAVPQETGPPPA